MWRILAGTWRYLWRAFTIAVALFVGYVAVTGVQVWLTSRHSEERPAQAIVVMGAAQYNGEPSPDLAARLADAQSLWRRHLAPLVVVTGYKEAGDHYTEAQASGTWLVDHGLAADDIVEVGGNDSWANLLDAADALAPAEARHGADRHRRFSRGPLSGHRHRRRAPGMAGSHYQLADQGVVGGALFRQGGFRSGRRACISVIPACIDLQFPCGLVPVR